MNSRQRIFISGVSSGIGFALTEHYLNQGAAVYGVSRRAPATLLGHPNMRFAVLDITRSKEVPGVIGTLLDSVTKLNLAILNAGVLGSIADLRDQDLDEMKHVMDINLWANVSLVNALFDTGDNEVRSIDQLVMISSGAAVNGNRGWGAYCLSKAALNMLARLAARERPETHVTALAPGLVDTAMQDYLCSLEPDARFSSLANLRQARGTTQMPPPAELAPRLAMAIDRLRRCSESGDFVDIRNLP